jgi:hypothetical protein
MRIRIQEPIESGFETLAVSEISLRREHLSEEDHAHILQKMVAGSIASRETIIESLDRSGDVNGIFWCAKSLKVSLFACMYINF